MTWNSQVFPWKRKSPSVTSKVLILGLWAIAINTNTLEQCSLRVCGCVVTRENGNNYHCVRRSPSEDRGRCPSPRRSHTSKSA